MGANCRHHFYPFFKGISENAYRQATLDDMAGKTVTYEGKKMSQYDASQVQRGIERKIRYWKRQASALEAAGLDNAGEVVQVKAWQAKMRGFVKQTGLKRQPEREGIYKPENPKKTIGFSFLSGDTRLSSTAQARALGESQEGWGKYEVIFKKDYLAIRPFLRWFWRIGSQSGIDIRRET